ncbi:M23 family metallopeptidase [Enhygromyxa salina]|uniref:M23 family metallopeptidase n=1 Tax=Enhygromyxa salina TaxID=215803 RepID=UPI0011B23568|nr:M23 family metallopeptidase [Enhygromyxa salina]
MSKQRQTRRPASRSGAHKRSAGRSGQGRARSRAKAKRKPAAKSAKTRRSKSKGNRRVEPGKREAGGRGRGRGKARDPKEFKARNRTILLLLVLAFINAWIFVWRDEGGLDSFDAKAAVIGGGVDGQGFAAPLEAACGGDPVQVFANLDDRLRLETKLDQGRTLRLALLELGLAAEPIDELEAEIRGTMDLGMLTGSGAPVRIAGDREGGLQALEIEVSEGHLIQACRTPTGLEVRNIQHPLRVDVAVIAVELPKNGSLLEAVVEAEQTSELARMIANSLAAEVDFTADTRPGDKIQVLVEKRYLGRNFHRYGKLLAIRYIGAAGRMAFYRYKPKGADEGFFDHGGQPMRRALLRTPFAWHPIDPEARASLAPAIEFIDGRMGAVYRRPLGAPVVAVADGTIRGVGLEGDDGLIVELELDDGRRVRYANLMRTIGDRAPGDRVEQGAVLGLVGQTGKTPVPRLRLELIDRAGERLDPMALGERRSRVDRVGDPIPEDQLGQFEDDIQSWRRAMRKAAE